MILTLVIIVMGFFLPFSITHWSGLLIKSTLFILCAFLLLHTFPFFEQIKEKFQYLRSNEIEDPFTEQSEDESPKDEKKIQPGEAFQWYLKEFLTVTRSVFVASCAGIYLNHGKQGLVFYGGATAAGFNEQKQCVPDGDLVDQLAKGRAAIIENNLPMNMQLTGFDETDIRSFMGVPLIWNNDLVGVLSLGSDTTETFNEEDKETLAHYAQMFTQVMLIYFQSLRWETANDLLQAHLQIEKTLKFSVDEESAIYGFVQHLKALFQFDRLTICLLHGQEAIVRHVYGQVDDIDRGYKFSLDQGLNGWILKRNSALLISDMQQGDYQRPRYAEGENNKHGLRSFLGVPLGNKTIAWGVLSLESRSTGQYGEKSKGVLTALTIPLEFALERFLNQQMANQNLSISNLDSKK